MTDTNSIDNSKTNQVKKDGRRGGNRKRATAEQFLDKAKKIHGTKFDYSKTIYNGSMEKVVITCRTHGDFKQVSSSHLRSKYACPNCAVEATRETRVKSTKDFVSAANKKHNNKYGYSKTKYVGSAECLTIICTEHGEFKRTAASHLFGYGCNICAGVRDRVKTLGDFIERAKEVHGKDRYDYSKSVYKNTHEKIKIICSKHGSFEQVPASHLQGNGCSSCANELVGGYSRSDFMRKCDKNKNGNATLYVIRCYNDRESFYKVGITSNDLQTRFESKREMPYGFDEVYSIDGEAGYVYDLEVRLHSLLKPYLYKPDISFRGYTECFATTKPIDSLLRRLVGSSQLQLMT